MDDRYKCQFCENFFANKSNLNRHLKTNIHCLQLRNEDIPLFECEYCEKKFVHKTNLNLHLQICKIKENTILNEKIMKRLTAKCHKLKKQNNILQKTNKSQKIEIEKIKNRIQELEQENERQRGIIDGLKTAPDKRTIYNTAIHPKLVNLPINNIPALTDEFVQQKVDEGILTYEKAVKGYVGMLDVICDLITHENDDGIVERNYVCTDISRNSFHRLLESKKWKSDKGGRYLNSMLDSFQDTIQEHKNRVYDKYKETSHDSIEWENVEWERKKISQLYSGIVCKEGTEDRNGLVNLLRKEISKRASV